MGLFAGVSIFKLIYLAWASVLKPGFLVEIYSLTIQLQILGLGILQKNWFSTPFIKNLRYLKKQSISLFFIVIYKIIAMEK